MRPVLLIDIGSTYTKLTAVDPDARKILGTSSAYTTVHTDVNEGLNEGLRRLEEVTGKLSYTAKYACSSAAGGLRMMVSGLVPELTSEAGRLASLGAGAKVIGQFSYELTHEDLEQIKEASPDIFLLVGGTDGGNTKCILHNAGMLASIRPEFPVIVAGNRTARAGCMKCLADCEAYACENVMPKFGVVNAGPAQEQIREIFLKKIIEAKGLSRASDRMDGPMMPTPAAVMKALRLLAEGTAQEDGIGDLVAVDVGGATTDVYSMADGMPREMNTVYKGLPEPYAKRTVEGDIGMRYSLRGIIEEVGTARISELSGISPERVEVLAAYLSEHTDLVPDGDAELEAFDEALASMAVETAMKRHAGTMEQTYTMMGLTYVQAGKNLMDVRQIVVTGGSLIHTKQTTKIAAHALYSEAQPDSLRPKQADIRVDRRYILASMGLLSETEPEAALQIMKKELEKHGNPESET